jgi:hypothetical protein
MQLPTRLHGVLLLLSMQLAHVLVTLLLQLGLWIVVRR